ncbi:DMT family transporter [Desulfatibacillum aliphaticivorans]|uniref:DMT family transporter n=1 Tax=Desulfatibacillum aliphaticivorans TaxID=218208 RepID=UPI00040F2A30|nr:DMT family transporter [Desulfatibacillum aliphaticivorans]
MNLKVLKANLILLTAALVWGSTFVFQRSAMQDMDPVSFSGLRFALGALCLAPIAYARSKRPSLPLPGVPKWLPLAGMIIAGTVMCFGINFQQVGLVETTAGKAGFITGLYVIMVPILGLAFKQKPDLGLWLALPLAVTGMYLLSVTDAFYLAPGDGLVLICAFMWAVHVLVVGYFSPRMDSFVLGFGQAFVCAILSLIYALCRETITWEGVWASRYALLYGGIGSVAIGFTLQIIGQKDSPAAHAAIILQLEAVTAAVSGWLFLGESMTTRSFIGAGLMLAGMLVAQLWVFVPKRKPQGNNGTP